MSIMGGFILRLYLAAMGYFNLGDYPMIFFASDSTKRDILNHQQPQGSGATNGDPYNLFLSCMLLVSKMWAESTQSTWLQYSKNIMKYKRVWRVTIM